MLTKAAQQHKVQPNSVRGTMGSLLSLGAFYLFIANFFATQIIGGAKELVVLL